MLANIVHYCDVPVDKYRCECPSSDEFEMLPLMTRIAIDIVVGKFNIGFKFIEEDGCIFCCSIKTITGCRRLRILSGIPEFCCHPERQKTLYFYVE